MNAPAPLRVGLTGGIASGKSAAAEVFARLGTVVLDSDRIAREVVEPGMPALAALVADFGAGILDRSGCLDRRRLRDLIFADPDARQRAESILHPAIIDELRRRSEAAGGPYQVLVIPLLVEGGHQGLVDRVLVVDCPEELQVERLLRRDGETPRSARRALAAQATRAERLAAADDVIVNDRGLDELAAEVAALDRRYLALASAGADRP